MLASAFALALVLAACAPRTSQSVAADVPPTGWTEPVEMRYENNDTVSISELRLSLRHSAAATRAEGRYVLWSVSPRGAVTSDTLAVVIAPDARTGNKLSETAAERPLTARLAEPGEWRLTVTPLQNTRGVWSVAITVSN